MILLGESLQDLDDDDVADLRLRAVGMVYQSYNLFSGFTVRQNVRLPLQLMTRRPPFDASQRTDYLLADFGLPIWLSAIRRSCQAASSSWLPSPARWRLTRR